MGKSITATMMGHSDPRGCLPTGSTRADSGVAARLADARATIRIRDLMQMSSGLRTRAPQDPDYDPSGPYPEHVYLYTGTVNAFHYAAARPLQWPPGTVGLLSHTDPVLINYLIRLAVEKRGESLSPVPATRALRQTRHTNDGDRNGCFRKLSHAGK